MKRTVIFCAGLLALALPLAADSASASSSLKAAYDSGFYPGVVRYADEILKQSPGTPAAAQAAVYKGESLYRMGRLEEARAALEAAPLAAGDSPELYAGRSYWLGRICSDTSDWQGALSAFLEAAKASKDRPEASGYYAYSLFYAGGVYYTLGDYEKAQPLYRYVISHGRDYALADYQQAAVKLLDLLVRRSLFTQAADLAAQLEEAPFSEDARYRLLLSRGDALSGLQDYKGAYRLYGQVLADCDDAALAVTALQKAYQVSSSHREAVGQEPGALLAQAQERLSAYPALLADFWLRLSIDAYSAGDRQKAAAYFAETDRAAAALAAGTGASAASAGAGSGESPRAAAQRIQVTSALYQAELALTAAGPAEASSSALAQGARSALALLDEKIGPKSPSAQSPLYGSVSAARARFYGLCGDWKNCMAQAEAALASGDSNVYAAAVYWKAAALYQTGAYSAVSSFIRQQEDSHPQLASDPVVQTLHARALAQAGSNHDADLLFYALGEKGALDNDGTLDYAKSLLNGGFMISASAQAGKASGAEADYLSALAAFNRRQWKSAVTFFTKSLAAGKDGSGDALDAAYVPYAQFYCGYAQYRSGLYQAAYRTLSDFIAQGGADSAKLLHLRFLAITTAVRASVQAGSYSQALSLAEEAISAAQNDEQKQEAVLLCAGVYTDAGQYDKALAVLAPYASGRNDFAWQCRYTSAQIQSQKKDYASADKTYASLAKERSAGLLAEEAAYRRGELAYSAGRYGEAVSLFDEYGKKWRNGLFYDASLFFAANALVQTDEASRASLYYQQILDLRGDSPYKYSACKNLMELYKNQRDYQKAISYAQKLLDTYGEQAKNDGVSQALEELHLLDLGYDEPTAAKEREYDRLGKVRTAAGRAAGTELVSLWASSAIYKQRAAALAQSLLVEQKKHLPEEAADAAKNALLAAKYLREQTENVRAAELYLEAAGYARSSGKDEEAASALYGAVEAFDAAKRYGDARATAKQLSELYPKSRFVPAAKSIVEEVE